MRRKRADLCGAKPQQPRPSKEKFVAGSVFRSAFFKFGFAGFDCARWLKWRSAHEATQRSGDPNDAARQHDGPYEPVISQMPKRD